MVDWDKGCEVALAAIEAERRVPREDDREAARARVAAFLEAWDASPNKTDIVYGLGFGLEAEVRTLTTSDLRSLL